jgi:hypothetical protein
MKQEGIKQLPFHSTHCLNKIYRRAIAAVLLKKLALEVNSVSMSEVAKKICEVLRRVQSEDEHG